MVVVFSESAKTEVRHAAHYYEDEVDGLGKSFLAYVESSIEEVECFPLASRVIGKGFRRFLVPRFPYGIIYRVDRDTVFVAAVMHLKRRPFYWEDE